MRLMSMWLLGRYVASTVILVPESFGGCWPRRCGQLRGDKERPFSGVTSSGRWAISGVSLLPPSFVVCQFSFTRRRRIVESACVLLFRFFFVVLVSTFSWICSILLNSGRVWRTVPDSDALSVFTSVYVVPSCCRPFPYDSFQGNITP